MGMDIKMKDYFKKIFFFIYEILYKILICSSSKLETKDIIVVKIDLIGDFIIWLSAAEKIREKYKGRKITLFCNTSNKIIALKSGYFDEIIDINDKKFKFNLFYRIRKIKQIKKITSNLVLNLVYSRDCLGSDWIVRSINSIKKIGIDGDFSNSNKFLRIKTDKWYTELIKIEYKPRHEIEINSNILTKLWSEKVVLKTSDLSFLIDDSSIMKENDYIVVLLGTSNSKKQIDLTKFMEVIQILDYNKIVLCGLNSEKKMGEQIEKNYLNKKIIYNLIGKTTLLESINLINKAKIVIGNDTGLLHVAVTLGVNSVVFVGGGHYKRFFPYPNFLVKEEKLLTISSNMDCFYCNWKCKYKMHKNKKWMCIENIRINENYKKLLLKMKMEN